MMDRPITETEAAVVQWLLDHAAMGDISAYRAHSPGTLRVVGGCTCGCVSLDFLPKAPGGKIVADALAVYPDGQEAGLILWGRDGEIASLEVYDHHPDASHRPLELANLRTWEQRGEDGAKSQL
jgi:hypothetical protein